jgi:hypothetical protein
MRALILAAMAVGVGALAPTAQFLSAERPATASTLGRQLSGARFARGPVACAAAPAPAVPRTIVVTDMDETLISKKSTGYVIAFLLKSRSLRILLVPLLAAVRLSPLHRRWALRLPSPAPCGRWPARSFIHAARSSAKVLIPVSKVSRTFAVRVMYWFAFRGVRVDRAKRVAEEFLAPRYVADLQVCASRPHPLPVSSRRAGSLGWSWGDGIGVRALHRHLGRGRPAVTFVLVFFWL